MPYIAGVSTVTDQTVLRAFSYRVKDATSGKRLAALSNAVNTVWNYVNEISARSADRGPIWATKKQLRDLTNGSGKLLGLPSQVVQEVIDEYVIKRRAARRSKLRWRASRGPKRALGWVPFTNQDIALDGSAALLRGQRFRLWLHRAVEGQIKSGNFSQDARGRWYCNFVCEVPRSQGSGRDDIGVDLGLKSVAKCSDGTELEQARFYRDLEPKLAEAQRKKRKRQVKSIHAKIANRRKDALHKFSRALVDRARKITVGDVSASAMTKTRMAKRVLDAGWSTLRGMLRYKCDHAGVAYAEVNEANTTRTCSSCGCLSGPAGLAGLSIRRWRCSECGAEHDRDQNAARNIARLGCETPCPHGHGSPAF
ncbi:RNA-guided endonuclease InsQ/TnpB family protein [Methylobacterium brachiatum]|jgi:IS605 OrfB family transposase|uniref:RNA-guided endonuclease InsQ/TnpB family protein n=1 Tax=Methylobacterium brachiatum TaxID=269660 RepID=UPI002449CC01|nr:transposase [Methylobacterium brachiatum]MDH2313861.1 transposase [Methylobacterium brachiatum]